LRLVETLYGVRDRLPTIVGDALRTGPLDIVRGVVFVSDRDLRPDLRRFARRCSWSGATVTGLCRLGSPGSGKRRSRARGSCSYRAATYQ
jgi:hypothetical protein